MENLRKIDEHEGMAELEARLPNPNFETARQLFVEQLDFLDTEKYFFFAQNK